MELSQYVLKRLLAAMVVFFIISIFTFSILHLSPGDPILNLVSPRLGEEAIEEQRKKFGLDQPLYVQYFDFMKNTLTGNFGISIYRKRKISYLILQRLPNTLNLTVAALFVSYLIALPAGIIAALNRGKILDHLSVTIGLLGLAIPQFWLGLMLILLFSGYLGWFPVGGYGSLQHLVLPALTLGAYGAALTTRVTRSSMLEVLNEQYISTARAKGLAERVVVYKHGLKNALIPVISLLGMRLGWLVGGAVVVETVFNRPGIGRLLIDSIYQRDYPVVQILMLILVTSVVIGNLGADIVCAVVNPKIRYR